jgi:hypothetical protein
VSKREKKTNLINDETFRLLRDVRKQVKAKAKRHKVSLKIIYEFVEFEFKERGWGC